MANKLDFKTRAEQGIVLFDGAMGTMLHAANLPESAYDGKLGCSEILLRTRPDVIKGIHAAYFAAGSDAVQSNSFGASALVLEEYGIADQARALSREAAALAREVADLWSDPDRCPGGAAAAKPRFVYGSIGPGTKLVSLGQTDWDTMLASYREQVLGLVEGGVDLLLIETCQDLLQIKCAICAAHDVFAATGRELPVIVTVTVETTGTLLVGSTVEAVVAALEPYGLFALGMNCATGPHDMTPHLRRLAAAWPGRIALQPNAGLPQNVNGELKYTLPVADFVTAMEGFVTEQGVGILGGCCGTNPDYIAGLAAMIPRVRPAERRGIHEPQVGSLFAAQSLKQELGAFYIGERTNTNGSKAFRDLLVKDDYDGLVDVASEQQGTGVHALDVCVAYTGRDEIADMRQTLRRFVTRIELPLVIDSTEVPVLEAALKMYGGRAIINSINLEEGEERADRICRLAKRYGAALIALTIDETGMARTVEHKLAVATRIHDIAVKRHGLKPSDLIFDCLTFTLGSGDETLRDSALNTMEGIRRVKAALPGVFTTLGLSNVSFGLSPASRKVLNSVFLHDCVAAGLDSAIVNLKQILPLAQLAEDDKAAAWRLIRNERKLPDGSEGDPLFDFINHFQAKEAAGLPVGPAEADTATLPVAERLRAAIIKGSKGRLATDLEEARTGTDKHCRVCGEPLSSLEIINDILIPAMKEVGRLFGDGTMQLPFVLQSAEVMKAAVDLLEPFMEKKDAAEQVSIVLATVRGDVHDIGKNLVDIILSNNGYKVHNLGIKCEIETIIQKAKEVKAQAIGMSGLLVKSTMVMKENIAELARQGLSIPVLLGGAALTPSYVYEACAADGAGPVMYCADAFDGLRGMNLVKEGGIGEFVKAEGLRIAGRKALRRAAEPVPAELRPENIDRSVAIPQAPFLGVRQVTGIDLDAVYGFLTEEVLFRGRWGYRRAGMAKADYDKLIDGTVRPEFEALKARCKADGLLKPAVSYGYFECNASGESVVLWDPAAPGKRRELARLAFPRQAEGARRCIADYFLPLSDSRTDLIALQVCTVGMRAAEHSKRLYEDNRYKDYLLFHGLSVEAAEALAEYWHAKVRAELGITGQDGAGIADFVVQKYQGSRYSFGYPACPDLEQNRILCRLSESEKVGVTVSEGLEMVPEQTTSAFIVHHPQAKYFNV
jgi:5-methyltetrahydrofolate--homocysteine methyltransferase